MCHQSIHTNLQRFLPHRECVRTRKVYHLITTSGVFSSMGVYVTNHLSFQISMKKARSHKECIYSMEPTFRSFSQTDERCSAKAAPRVLRSADASTPDAARE